MSPQEIRDLVDTMHARMVDGHINTAHVAAEQTLRALHGHPTYIGELDGARRFHPTPQLLTQTPAWAVMRQLGEKIAPVQELWEQQRAAVIAMLTDRYGIRAYRSRSGVTISHRDWVTMQRRLNAPGGITRVKPTALAEFVPPTSLPITILVGSWWTIARLRLNEWRSR